MTNAYPPNSILLSDLHTGEWGEVTALTGGQGFVGRMAALGFTPGAPIRLLQNRGRGPVIACVRDMRLALGRGEACKILVRPLSKDGQSACDE